MMVGKKEMREKEEILTDGIHAVECRADRHNRCARVWQRQTTADCLVMKEFACKKDSNKYWRRSEARQNFARAKQSASVRAFGIGMSVDPAFLCLSD